MANSFLHCEQASFNLATRENWQAFTEHREMLRSLLLNDGMVGKKHLGVVGAGNCNDLDLPELMPHFENVALLDLDVAAMQLGVARQFPQGTPSNLFLEYCEATGVLAELDALKTASEPEQTRILHHLAEKLGKTSSFQHEKAPFDVMVSACLLSQLIGMVKTAVGEEHPRFVSLVQAIRRQHVRWMLQQIAPGGLLIMLLDFVSSDTAPEIVTTPHADLNSLAMKLIASRNFFTGMNPGVVRETVNELLVSRGQVQSASICDCWRWNLGPRVYLTTALLAKIANAPA